MAAISASPHALPHFSRVNATNPAGRVLRRPRKDSAGEGLWPWAWLRVVARRKANQGAPLLSHCSVTPQQPGPRDNERGRARALTPRRVAPWAEQHLTMAGSRDLCCAPARYKIVSYPDCNLKKVVVFQGRLN